jgi:prepilin-type N-terminal cleavage/methylation domain-containing protein
MAYKQRGDTLVEVLMSIVVLSLVIVGAVTLMTRGLQATQIALEHSEVRQEVNSQIELLKYLRNQYVLSSTSADAATWLSIISSSNISATDYTSSCIVTPAKAGTAFYLNKPSGTVVKNTFDINQKPPTYATAGKGVWIEATPSNSITPAYVDFVVRACWQGSGATAQQQTVTALRLYDPSH